jgi:protein gp37
MGENSRIEWTEHTFNPAWGCTKVSEGCAHCYAETWAKRTGFKIWGQDAERRFFGDKHWAEPIKWDAEAKKLGVMHRVFCGSMCDIFEDREDMIDPRMAAFDLADATPNLLWLFLTKRPQNARAFLPPRWAGNGCWPRNIMLGATIENQQRLIERVRHLRGILREFPGASFFASCEPLLSSLDWKEAEQGYGDSLDLFDWVIGGGESGPGARPMHIDWIRKLRDDCEERTDMARPWPVQFLFKQWGEYDSQGRKAGKKYAGRVLDGRTWDGVPHLTYGPQLPGVDNHGAVALA